MKPMSIDELRTLSLLREAQEERIRNGLPRDPHVDLRIELTEVRIELTELISGLQRRFRNATPV